MTVIKITDLPETAQRLITGDQDDLRKVLDEIMAGFTEEEIDALVQVGDALLEQMQATAAALPPETIAKVEQATEKLLGKPAPCDFSDADRVGAEATADYCYANQSFCD